MWHEFMCIVRINKEDISELRLINLKNVQTVRMADQPGYSLLHFIDGTYVRVLSHYHAIKELVFDLDKDIITGNA